MKPTTLPLLAAATVVTADINTWKPPGAYDVRGPCPMLNSLTNHGFLPHHGKDLTRTAVSNALFDALHVNHTLGSFLFDFGLLTSPSPNATTWSLNDLGAHNVLEHDASLSRSDAYFGSPLTFNQSVFDETKGYWGPGEVVDVRMAADARAGRIGESRRVNPEFELSELGSEFAFGESVAYVLFLGDAERGVANRTWVEWFFEHEELPRHFGWKRPENMFQENDLNKWMDVIKNLTKPDPEAKPAVRRSKVPSHWGF
ncbi:Chloroperoxidase [Podospora conica]|nr:Chloroperoxidase [Schizothecium conicum]